MALTACACDYVVKERKRVNLSSSICPSTEGIAGNVGGGWEGGSHPFEAYAS